MIIMIMVGISLTFKNQLEVAINIVLQFSLLFILPKRFFFCVDVLFSVGNTYERRSYS